MIYKQGGISLDINARKSSAQSTNIQFFTQDTGSAKLSFSFTKDGVPLPLSAVDAKIVLLYADDSFYKRSLTLTDKVNGKAEYVLSDEELKHYGEVKAEIKLYYTNGQALATVFFTFHIEKTLEDQNIVPVAEYYIDDFETLRAGINKTVAEISQTFDEIKAKFAEFENIETKQGAQDKVDAALTKAKKYTDEHAETPDGAQSKADDALKKSKEFVSGFQQKKITTDSGMPLISIKDTSVSILDVVINNGLGQGTFYAIAGSKDLPNHRSFRGFFHITDAKNEKGTFGWVYATDYANNIYTNYLNNNVWSGWSRLSNHNMLSEDGKSQPLPNGTDILTLPSGCYYAVGTNVVNMPSKTDSSWFNIYVIDNGNNRKTYHIIRSGDNLHWWGTVHTDGKLKSWDRMLTEEDLSSTWNQVTLVAGKSTKHFAGNPLKFSIRQNELRIRGSFEGIPANETVIARFAQKPSAKTVFLGATVGSYGSARFTLEKDGSLRFDGMSANDNSFVSRFEINESIPLW